MKTLVLPAAPEAILEAARIIKEGGVVGMPTETVYGLAADARSDRAVRRIFEAKNRPADNPLIAHIASMEQLGDVAVETAIPEYARRLMRAYWPGPLTLVLPKAAGVADAVTAGLLTVGVRIPDHPVARTLIEAAGRPLAAPSANASGRPSPTTAAHVLRDMDGKIPLILDGGACEVGIESTVVDATGAVPRVLRPGGVTPEMIEWIVGAVEVDGSALRPLGADEPARSPGMKYRHYAPAGALTLFRGAPDAVAAAIRARYDEHPGESAVLALPSHRTLYGDRRCDLMGEGDSPERVAAALFAALRKLDDEGVAYIYAETVPTNGVGLAVMNRLIRAAGYHVVDVDG